LTGKALTPEVSSGLPGAQAQLESAQRKIRQLVYRTSFATRAQAQFALFDFIEVFYNRQRRHSALGGIPPALFESKNNEQVTPFSLYAVSKQPHPVVS
jgi:transposase InsO family protein